VFLVIFGCSADLARSPAIAKKSRPYRIRPNPSLRFL